MQHNFFAEYKIENAYKSILKFGEPFLLSESLEDVELNLWRCPQRLETDGIVGCPVLTAVMTCKQMQ